MLGRALASLGVVFDVDLDVGDAALVEPAPGSARSRRTRSGST